MSKRQSTFQIGKVTSGSLGAYNLNIGGRAQDIERVPSGQTNNEDDQVLVCFLDDDTPLIIGKAGYRTPL